jgi:hypothetical protein
MYTLLTRRYKNNVTYVCTDVSTLYTAALYTGRGIRAKIFYCFSVEVIYVYVEEKKMRLKLCVKSLESINKSRFQ